MGAGGKKQTVGYKYFLGSHMVLAHGPFDAITEIQVDRRVAWEGDNFGDRIEVNAPLLFGGDQREGGVSGSVDVLMGYPDQMANDYLIEQLGSDVPAFRGVVSLVLRQCYMGNNPYLKPWAITGARVYQSGWEADTAGIVRSDTQLECLPFDCEAQINQDPAWIQTVFGQSFNFEDVFPIADVTPRGFNDVEVTDWDVHLLPRELDFGSSNLIDTCEPAESQWLLGVRRYGYLDVEDMDVRVMSAVMTGVGTAASARPTSTHWEFTVQFEQLGYFQPTGTHQFRFLLGSSGQIQMFAGADNTTTSVAALDMSEGDQNSFFFSRVEIEPIGGGRALNPNNNNIPYLYIDVRYEFAVTNKFDENLDGDQVPIGAIVLEQVERVYVLVDASEQYEIGEITMSRIKALGPFTGSSGERRVASFKIAGAEAFNLLGDEWIGVRRNQETYEPPGGCSCLDMNPAHIIYECLLDDAWGLGYTEADINADAFLAAADTLFAEGMGMSILWEREQPIEDFIGEILRHIDAVLYVSRETGKFVLKLIRDDTDSTAITLDETNVSEITSAKRPTVSELTNAVTIVYWDPGTDENASVTVHNEALRQIQGVEISTTIQYPGFTGRAIADRVAQRDLIALSTPLLSCNITASRQAAALNPGDAFYLDWPDLEINNTLMRANNIDYGDGISNEIIIEAVQDVFDTPAVSVQEDQESIWVDPTLDVPLSAVARAVQETPYYLLVLELGQLNADAILDDDADAGFLLAAGGRQANELNADIYVNGELGGSIDFHPYAYIDSDVGYTDTELLFTSQKDIDLVELGTIAQIGSELVRVDAVNIDSNGNYISVTVGRGILDTVPQRHPVDSNGTPIIFLQNFADSDDVQYASGENIAVRLQTKQSTLALDLGDTPSDLLTFDSRAIRPYPPGNLLVDSLSYPVMTWTASHVLTWAHRDRVQQTDGNLYDYTTSNIGPEPGTTYLVEGYAVLEDSVGDSSSGEIVKFLEVDAGSATTLTIDIDSGTFDSNYDLPPDETTEVILKVFSVRDGYRSQQGAEVSLQYPGFTDSTS